MDGHRVSICVNLDDSFLMALVVVIKSSFSLFSMFTTVNEYVRIVILSLVPLASFSAMRKSVISASSTEIIHSNDDFFFLVYNCCHHPCLVT